MVPAESSLYRYLARVVGRLHGLNELQAYPVFIIMSSSFSWSLQRLVSFPVAGTGCAGAGRVAPGLDQGSMDLLLTISCN